MADEPIRSDEEAEVEGHGFHPDAAEGNAPDLTEGNAP